MDNIADSIGFDRSTGKLSIFGNAGNNTVQEWISDDGYLQLMLDGHAKSSDPLSAFFDSRLQGATRETLTHINFDGGEGRDTLIVGNQSVGRLEISADDDILINGNAIAAGSLDVSADTITTTGSLTGSKVNLNSRDALKLESGSKITSQAGDKGGTVHLLGKEVSLTGAAIDASGVNGGGTVLIGGDCQGKGSVPNARTTFIDASTVINVDALQNGNGGRAIVWADDTTRFLGKINARGGSGSGDGGFAEVSGKQNLLFQGLANLSTTHGAIGTLLLDPTDIIISQYPVGPNTGYPEDVQVIYSASLEASTASINLVATNAIRTPNLNFVSPGGSIAFVTGAGGFIGGGIKTSGRNVTIAGDFIVMQEIDTSSETASGGEINLISKGEISAGNINGSSGSGEGGAITIKAENNINTGALGTNTFSTGTAGNIDITSMRGNVNTYGGIASNSWLGSAGKIALQAAGSINAGEVNSRSDGTGNGGDIKLEATENITTGELRSYVYGNGNSGNINVKSDNGIIDIKEVQSGAYGSGTAGNIDITSTSSSINTNGSAISSNSWSGTAGNITLLAADTIDTGEVNSRSDGPGNAGNIDLHATGDITTKELRSYVWGAGNGGAIALTSTDGNITSGSIRSDSTQGTGGNITIDAAKLVKVTGSENIDAIDYSIYTNGPAGDSLVTINYNLASGEPDTDFALGDSDVNGTKGSIGAKDSRIFAISTPFILPHDYEENNIKINTLGNPPANQLGSDDEIIGSDGSDIVIGGGVEVLINNFGPLLPPDFVNDAAAAARYIIWFGRGLTSTQTGLLHPTLGVGDMTSDFGERNISYGSRFHQGVDIAAPEGTPIVAVADGVVIFSGEYPGGGYSIAIKHKNNWVTRIFHMYQPSKLAVGKVVKQGDYLGGVGGTFGYPVHLHIQLERPDGKAVDIEPYLNLTSTPIYQPELPDRTPGLYRKLPTDQLQGGWF